MAVAQLSDSIPALVLNRTNAFMAEAREQGLSFLTDILLNNTSPQLAISRAYLTKTSGMSSTAWMTPILFQHYAEWVFPQSSIASFTSDPNWRLKLDRVPQFSQVHYHTATMIMQCHPLTLACFWHGVKGQGVDRFHQSLPVELRDLELNVKLESFSFQWPNHFSDRYAAFEFMLQTGFSVDKLDFLPQTLEQRYLGNSTTPLLLHCRFATLQQQCVVKLEQVKF
jgi:hypothetical protein